MKFCLPYFLILILFLAAPCSAQSDNVSVGIDITLPFQTVKFQALSGNWNVNLYPLTPGTQKAGSTERIFGNINKEKVTEYIVPGEDVSLLLVAKGIVARVSSEKDVDKGFDSVILEGGDLISIEIPETEPMIMEGVIQIDNHDTTLSIINRLSLEQFVVSSASVFGNVSSEIEAVKAYVIVARTKLRYLKENNKHLNELYEVCNTPHCMPFKGCGANRQMVSLLADQTFDKVITYNGKIINPRFHHTCGGKISSAKSVYGVDNEPYHPSHNDLKDSEGSENCFHSPAFHWTAEFPKFDFMDFIAVAYAGGIQNFYVAFEPETVDENGRITQLLFRGKAPLFLPGYDFANRAHKHFGYNSLKSMRFNVTEMKRSFLFKGMGKGDGVGMCLYGCDGLAKKGMKAEDIIAFYYPGTRVEEIPAE